jgi:hypothetical protein
MCPRISSKLAPAFIGLASCHAMPSHALPFQSHTHTRTHAHTHTRTHPHIHYIPHSRHETGHRSPVDPTGPHPPCHTATRPHGHAATLPHSHTPTLPHSHTPTLPHIRRFIDPRYVGRLRTVGYLVEHALMDHESWSMSQKASNFTECMDHDPLVQHPADRGQNGGRLRRPR